MHRVLTVPLFFSLSGCFLFGGMDDVANDDGNDTDLDGCPSLSLEVNALEWTNVPHQSAQSLVLEVVNDCVGTQALIVNAAATGDPAFSVVDPDLVIAPGDTDSLEVQFLPESPGSYEGLLKLTVQGLPPQSLSLLGSSVLNPDVDGDGFLSEDVGGDDCDDTNPDIRPGALDVCYDGLDANCDNASDNDCDGDGYNASSQGGTDCDDTDPDLHPGAPEQRDGLDQDCDGIADEGLIDEGDLVFSEMMPNPDLTPDSRGEWFEVRNTTSIPIDMTGWIVSRGSESFEVNTAVKVPAGGVRVFSNSDNPGRNGGFKSDFEFDAAAFGMPNTTNETYEIVFQSTRVASVVLQATKITAGASTGLDPRVSALASARDMTNWCTAVQSMSGGDLGTPGMPNDECPGLTDVDGDGYTLAGGDCDDSDASVHPGATEVWGDWIDNDCDGSSDTATITGLSSLYLDGDSSGSTPDFLGYRGNLSLGDVDADGTPELILGSYYAQEYLGGVYVVPSEDYASFGGSVSAVADATVVGFAEGHYLGAVDTHMADNTGDSRPDLVVAGHDYYEPDDNVAVAVFKGSSLLSGTLASTDATLLMTGSLSFKNTRVVSSADLNGDGVAEVVYGEGYDYYGAGEDNYAGRVVVVDTDGLSGTMALEDGDALWVGAVTYDYLGTAMGGGDLDGDGYDELLVGAAGEDTGASLAGSVYVVPGASSLPSSGTIEDEYSIKITGDTKNGKLGDGPAPQLADLDGDSRVDLVVSAYDVDTVYVFYDIASLTGVVSVSSADLAIQGSGAPDDFGLGLSTGDFDGDGFDDLAMGAPDDDTNDPGSHATVTGQVYVFLGSGLGSGSLTDSDADATVTGVSSAGGFGQSLLSMDLDGDGCDDLLVNAPGAQSNQGRVYFWVMK